MSDSELGKRTQLDIEKHIRKFSGDPQFTLTDEFYQSFLTWMKLIPTEPSNIEMALAFITIRTMGNDPFIRERDNVEEDIVTLIKVIIHMYKHVFDTKSTLLLLTEALDQNTDVNDLLFRATIIRGETNFEGIIALIRKPVQYQPVFVQ